MIGVILALTLSTIGLFGLTLIVYRDLNKVNDLIKERKDKTLTSKAFETKLFKLMEK